MNLSMTQSRAELRGTGQTPSQKRRRRRLEELVRLKQIEHLSNRAVADRLGICERSVYNLLSSEDYPVVVEEVRTEWRESDITRAHSLGTKVLDTLEDVMENSRSDIARYNAAAKLGDWIGLQRQVEEQRGDDRAELERLLRIREERAALLGAQSAGTGIAAYMEMLAPGGFLSAPGIELPPMRSIVPGSIVEEQTHYVPEEVEREEGATEPREEQATTAGNHWVEEEPAASLPV
jgi:hypothetical protein